jgi:hypothetical protein
MGKMPSCPEKIKEIDLSKIDSKSLSSREALLYCQSQNYPITKQGLKYLGLLYGFLKINTCPEKKYGKWIIDKEALNQYITLAKIPPIKGWITIRTVAIKYNRTYRRIHEIIHLNNIPIKYYGPGIGVAHVEEICIRKVLEKYRGYHKRKKQTQAE